MQKNFPSGNPYNIMLMVTYYLIFSSCIRNEVPIKVPKGVSQLCEISKD